MTRFNINYNGLIDRKNKIQEQEALGHTMLNDDFDSSWKSGEEPRGIMIFTDNTGIDAPQPRPIPRNLVLEYSNAPDMDSKLNIIAERLGLI